MLLLAGATVLGGCERPYLVWTPREPLAARRGRVAIAVVDHRAQPPVLGRVFGWGGVPRELTVGRDHARERVERLAREATVTAGLGLPGPAEAPTARLVVDVDTLWCDGGGWRAHASLAVRVSIHAPDGAPRLAPQVIAARGDGRGCQAAFAGALDVLLDELSARLVEGPGREAALGEGIAPPLVAPGDLGAGDVEGAPADAGAAAGPT